jgi:hypothetical protein
MTMGSLLLADIHAPLGSFFPCLLFLGYPIFFIYLMNRSVMGDIGCVTALLMAFTVTYLLFVIWKIEDTRVHYLAVGGVLTLFVALPVLEKTLDKIDAKAMEGEQISICYQQIRMNPQNAMAAFRLAKILWDRGEREVGASIASQALPHLPASAFREEHRMYHFWLTKVDITSVRDINCAACGAVVNPSALICPRCLGSVHLDRARSSSVLYNRKTQKIITIWSCLLIVLFLVPMMGQFPPAITIPTVIVLLGVAVWAVVSAFVVTGETK